MLTAIRRGVIRLYDGTHWFTDKEAWGLFRLFAFGEAIGWTMLISAIIYRHLHLPQSESVIYLAGRTHGMFFILYFVFALLTARSMGWGLWRVIMALCAGVGPYTSLVFEKIMAYHRKVRPVNILPPSSAEK